MWNKSKESEALETLKEQFYCAVVYAALYNYAGHRENTLFIHAFPFLV